MVKTAKMQLLEMRDPQGRDIREIVFQALNEAGNLRDAAERLGVTATCLSRWNAQMGITIQRRYHLAAILQEQAA